MGSMLLRLATTSAVVVFFVTGAPALAETRHESVRVPGASHSPEIHAFTVTVERGDHLWKISKRHLETQLPRSPGPNEIAPYWRTVIDENVDRLRSGDPDLIYPGEVIHLPGLPVSEQP